MIDPSAVVGCYCRWRRKPRVNFCGGIDKNRCNQACQISPGETANLFNVDMFSEINFLYLIVADPPLNGNFR